MIRGGMRVMIRPDSRSNRPAIEIADILRRHGEAYRRVHAGHLVAVAFTTAFPSAAGTWAKVGTAATTLVGGIITISG